MTSDQRSARPGREDAVATALPVRLSRRVIVAGSGAALLSAGVLSACGGESPTSRPGGGDRDDVELLNDALDFELSGVAAYAHGADLLSGELARTARRYADQSEAHVERLTELVSERGGTPLGPEADRVYRKALNLDQIDDADAFLALAVDFESAGVAGYSDAVTELSESGLRRVFYEIAANAAAHVAVLLGFAGEIQVPDAFVTGQPT
jgi:rubrerythrin